MKITNKHVLFWGGVFSQWHRCYFTIGEEEFTSAEQWMMVNKARLFDCHDIAEKIMATDDPSEQKKLGRKVRDFDPDSWNRIAKQIVYVGNHAKFTQNPQLLEHLMAYPGKTFVEASPFDKVWGIGMSEDEPEADDESKWEGTNWLGIVLTKLRNDMEICVSLE